MSKIEAQVSSQAIERLRTGSDALYKSAESIVVDSRQSYIEAGQVLSAIATAKRQREDFFSPFIQQASALLQSLCDGRLSLVQPLERAYKLIDDRMATWLRTDEERQRREAREAQLRAEAQQAEDRLAEARRLLLSDNADDIEAAESLLGDPEPDEIALPPTMIDKPKVAGFTRGRKLHKFRLKDSSKVKPEFMTPDLVKIAEAVRYHKGRAESIVGIGSIEYYTESGKSSVRRSYDDN